MSHSSIKIGIVDQASKGWAAGASYTRMIAQSLADACKTTGDQLYFLSNRPAGNDVPDAQFVQLSEVDYLPAEQNVRKWLRLSQKQHAVRGEAQLRNALRLKDKSNPFSVAEQLGIDVLLPLLDVPPWPVKSKTIGWIPDFQHVHLPQFFAAAELKKRDATIKRLLERAALIMLSSRAAEQDFIAYAPASAGKVRVASFPSLLAFNSLPVDATTTTTKFKLPEKFALVANQFWVHKNHMVVVKALAHLRKRGLKIPLVMTGLPVDERDPANANFSQLLQTIAATDVRDQITLLGHVGYSDLINLMRTAAVIIQPSRFEGWSTIVQDAKAIGRPVICSDLAVHREQAPQALGFFPVDEPEALAEILAMHWQRLSAGPEPNLEQVELQREREFAREHGTLLLRFCREAANAKA